jgi:hypothetical protein
LLKKWADALRSGKYEQTNEVLRDPGTNRMCCLGVLCDIVDPTKWDGERYAGVEALPPNNVLRMAGLTADRDALDLLARPASANQFARLNDEEGATYAEIADVVDWMRYDLEARS